MLVEAEAAEEAIEVTRSEPRGVVRMTCAVSLLDALVAPMLADFMVEYPRVEVHLEATNRRVDVIDEGVDIALRVRPPPLEDSELVMRMLAELGQCLVASPALLERHGQAQGPAELSRYPSLDLGMPQSEHAWKLFGPDGAQATIYHRPRFITRGMLALRAAATAGVGVVQLPTLMVTEQLARGELVPVIPDWRPRHELAHAVFASRRGLLPSVRVLVDFLARRFEQAGAG
jgi:DNA-binding transcriptional LysR family regulator